MSETPRQYKQRIDEKWKKNTINAGELIRTIEAYELLDEGFKTKTRQAILDNFQKNQQAEQESDQYKAIVSELEKMDKKYMELEDLKKKLVTVQGKKTQTEKDILNTKLDGEDETTLKIQMAEVRKLNKKLETLNSEIDELEKEIVNREREIKALEDTYGEKLNFSGDKSTGPLLDDSTLPHREDSNPSEEEVVAQTKPTTLKEFHEQTIQDLWNKDKTRGEIFELLEEGTGIDDSLKEKIKQEISDRFFEYYDEKQGSLRMKSARFVKNKLKTDSQYNDIWHKVENEKSEKSVEKSEKSVEKSEKSVEKSEKSVEKRKTDWLSSIITRNKSRRNLKSFRKTWKERIDYIDNYSKEKIIKVAKTIPVKVETESDGSRLIEFKLGNKTYKILDPKLKTHSDDEYFYEKERTFIRKRNEWVELEGMRGDDVNSRKNQKLKKYVQQKEKEGLHIAKIEEMRNLLADLREKARLDGKVVLNEGEQIAMLMYLTGMDGWYWLGKMGRSGGRYYRLTCDVYNRGFDYDIYTYDSATLCMIACN